MPFVECNKKLENLFFSSFVIALILFVVYYVTKKVLVYLEIIYIEGFDNPNPIKSLGKSQLKYAKCDSYNLGNVLQEILKNRNIQLDENGLNSKNWDIYIPCGYNNVERELPKIQLNNKYQIVFGIKGCDNIVSKNGIWTLLVQKYGRLGASEFMPNSYLMYDKNDMRLFNTDFDKKKLYIMKKKCTKTIWFKNYK